jgi:hypothetical protein
VAAGIRQRHGNRCKRPTSGYKCPWQAEVYSKRDCNKIRKLFLTRAQAVGWRGDAAVAVRKKVMRALTSTTLQETFDEWLAEARTGVVRTRSGHSYKPGSLRSYERAMRLRVLPTIGPLKLSDIARTDLQDIVDGLVAEGVEPSTVAGTMLPIRAIYRRAMFRGEIAVNPTSGLVIPTA